MLARAAQTAGIDWDSNEAHSARYDAEKTAELFCKIVNRWGEINPGINQQVMSADNSNIEPDDY